MKKTILLLGLFMAVSIGSYAQKYALIDMEYILAKIPDYQQANEKLEKDTKLWENEIKNKAKEAESLYKKYQADIKTLKGEQKAQKEKEIVAKENEINTLRNKYFGPEGEAQKRREAFMKPINDAIYKAVKDISTAEGYALVIDRASNTSIIFASPAIDISDKVLAEMR